MAVWLSMDMSYVGAGDYANTSKVAVNVYVHWDTVSYNGYSPALNVTVDGVNDTVNVSFNTGKTSSGSQNIYSRYWNIGHDSNGSARTVYASASYATGTASGTVGASTSLALDAINSGGGDSGGDSGGGDTGDNGGDEYTYTYTFHYIIGEHCTVERYWGTLQDTVTESKSQTLSSTTLNGYTFVFIADEGYMLSGCSVNGTDCDDDGEGYLVAYSGEYTIIASAVPTPGVYIDDGTNNSLYECYIDTEYVEYPTNDVNCTVVGHRSAIGTVNNPSWNMSYYGVNTNYQAWLAYRQSASSTHYYVYWLKFTTPTITNMPKSIKIELVMEPRILLSNLPAHYALCTSDENYPLYLETISAVNDSNQISSGTFTYNTSVSDSVTNTIIVEVDNMQSNTTYYLAIWDATIDSSDRNKAVAEISAHTITLTCEDRSQPTYRSKFDLYIPYIDNGTSWEIIS